MKRTTWEGGHKGPAVPLDPKVQGGGFAHVKQRQVGGHQHTV
jgi:hypothetical protein